MHRAQNCIKSQHVPVTPSRRLQHSKMNVTDHMSLGNDSSSEETNVWSSTGTPPRPWMSPPDWTEYITVAVQWVPRVCYRCYTDIVVLVLACQVLVLALVLVGPLVLLLVLEPHVLVLVLVLVGPLVLVLVLVFVGPLVLVLVLVLVGPLVLVLVLVLGPLVLVLVLVLVGPLVWYWYWYLSPMYWYLGHWYWYWY